MSTSTTDTVLLIHGTFAGCDHDTLPADQLAERAKLKALLEGEADPDRQQELRRKLETPRPRWWQRSSEFEEGLDGMLAGTAKCWDGPMVSDTRQTFSWSGKNSDIERRRAGARLYQHMQRLEAEQKPYHLIGHSHGGTVAWLALQLAAGADNPLPHLRSWTTLGTPFPTFRPPVLLALLRFLVSLALLLIVGWGVAYQYNVPVRALVVNGCDIASHGLSIASKVLMAGPLLLVLVFFVGLVTGFVRWGTYLRDQRRARAAWRRWGKLWLGLYSEKDEAINICLATVSVYFAGIFRLPQPDCPTRPHFRWAVWPVCAHVFWVGKISCWPAIWLMVTMFNRSLMPLVELVINFVLQAKVQGADRLGTRLAYIAPEPWFHANPRGFLPPLLDAALLAHARQNIAGAAVGSYDWVVSQLHEVGKGDTDSTAGLKAIAEGIKVSRDLIHNSYTELPELRRLIARHIRTRAGAEQTGVPMGVTHVVTDSPEWNEWLAQAPGAGCGQYPPRPGRNEDCDLPIPFRSQPQPQRVPAPRSDRTPAWSRVLMGALLVTVSVFALIGLPGDLRQKYFPHILTKVPPTERLDPHAEPVDLMRAFGLFAEEFLRDSARPEKVAGERTQAAQVPAIRLLAEVATQAESATQLGKVFVESPQFGEDIRQEAGAALKRIIERDAANVTASAVGLASLEQLTAGLRGEGGVEVRRQAAYFLAKVILAPPQPESDYPVKRMTMALGEGLRDGDLYVQLQACSALGKLKGRVTLVQLVPYFNLDSPEMEVAQRNMLADLTSGLQRPLRAEQQNMLRDLAQNKEKKEKFGEQLRASRMLNELLEGPEESCNAEFEKALSNTTDPDRQAVTAAKLVHEGIPPRIAVDYLLKFLNETTPDAPFNAAMYALPRCGSAAARAVPDLTALLNSKVPARRQAAAAVLGRIGETAAAAVPALLPLLEDKDDKEAQRAAADSLGRIGEKAVQALIPLLIDSKMRKTAAIALGRIGEKAAAAVPALLRLLEPRQDKEVRRAGAEAIGRIRAKDEEKNAVKALLPLLDDEEKEVRRAAVEALGRIGEKAAEAAPTLLRLLEPRQNKEVRRAAAIALEGVWADAKVAVPELLRLLEDEDEVVRSAAAGVFRRLGEKAEAAVPNLISLLEKKDLMLWKPVAVALGHIGGKAVPKLVGQLSNPDPNVQGRMAFALAEIGRKNPALVVQDLVREMGRNSAVWWPAVAALGQIGEPAKSATDALIKVLEDQNRKVKKDQSSQLIIDAVGGLGAIRAEKNAVTPLKRLLDDTKDPKVLLATVNALGRIGAETAEAVDKLLPLLQPSEDKGVRRATINALVEIRAKDKEKDAVTALMRLLDFKEDKEVRQDAASALGWIRAKDKEKDVVKALMPLLEDKNDKEVRRAAAFALERIGAAAADAESKLLQLLLEEDKGVRRAAAFALERIGAAAARAVPVLLKVRPTDLDESEFIKSVLDQFLSREARKDLLSLSALMESKPKEFGNVLEEVQRRQNELNPDTPLTWIGVTLMHVDRQQRQDAVALVVSLGREAVQPMWAMTKSPNAMLRVGAIEALGRLGLLAVAATPDLARLLGDPDSIDVRTAAKDALIAIGKASRTADVTNALTRKLTDLRPEVRAVALEALLAINPQAFGHPASSSITTAEALRSW